jgi:hypothetical protein
MTAPDHAFRATNPQLVAASLEAYDERRQEFFEAVEAFSVELGHEVLVLGDSTRLFANHLAGEWRKDGKYEQPEGGKSWDRVKVADIPPGWHFYVKDSEVRPYRGGRDKVSKDAVKALDALNKRSPGALGRWLQQEFGIQQGTPFISFGFEPVGEDYFVLTAKPRPGSFRLTAEWDGNRHFEPVPVSTYWLAKEAADAAEEAS